MIPRPIYPNGVSTELGLIVRDLQRAYVIQRTAMFSARAVGHVTDDCNEIAFNIGEALEHSHDFTVSHIHENIDRIADLIGQLEWFWGQSIETLADAFAPIFERAHDDAKAEEFRARMLRALAEVGIGGAHLGEGDSRPFLSEDQIAWYKEARERCGWSKEAERRLLQPYGILRIEDMSAQAVFQQLARDLQDPAMRDHLSATNQETPATVSIAA